MSAAIGLQVLVTQPEMTTTSYISDQSTANGSSVTYSQDEFSSSDSSSTLELDWFLGVWMTGAVCVLGSIGNIVSLVVLSQERSNRSRLLSLKALSAVDLVLLVSALFQQVLPLTCAFASSSALLCRNMGYVRVYSWPVVNASRMASIWLTVLVSAERFSTICKCWQPSIKASIGAVVLISSAFNVPKFFEYTTEVVASVDGLVQVVVADTSLRHNEMYQYVYNTALYCILIYAIPLISLLFFNIMIVVHIHHAKRMWRQLSQFQRREYKATNIPLCIVTVFLVTGTQSLMVYILDAVYAVDHTHYPTWLGTYTGVVNLLVVFNSAINFIIFYVFGARFRKLFWRILACCCKNYRRRNNTFNSPIFQRRFRERVGRNSTSVHTFKASLRSSYKSIKNGAAAVSAV